MNSLPRQPTGHRAILAIQNSNLTTVPSQQQHQTQQNTEKKKDKSKTTPIPHDMEHVATTNHQETAKKPHD
ncbi:hypothetical protein VTN49DRAFT_7486 [Thermomyces lanuginosus]|uniref:uncharacterized protein n=1 Tax=Thermomyces lanuginosus TaxID=5541 RepID=UPI0037447810